MRRLFHHVPAAYWALLMIAVPYALFALSKWYAIPLHDGKPVGQNDPDTWLRLTLVRDWLLGGSWYDHTVWHTDAPYGGSISPWTRPLDAVIALLVKLQPDSVDISLRLMRASLILPVLWMALLVLGMQRAIRTILPLPSVYVMASVMVIALPPLWNYFSLGNADHHAPLAVLFIWVLGGVLTQSPSRRLMLVTGAMLGLQLWISVEALILIAMIYVWYGICWLRGDAPKALQLAWLSSSAALTSLLAVMIERPMGAWLTPIYDSISIAQACALILAALLAWALYAVPTKTLCQRLMLSAAGSAALLTATALTYPALLLGPMVGVDPFIISDFLPNISEAKPYYKVSSSLVVSVLIIPLLGVTVCAMGLVRSRFAFYSKAHAAPLLFFLVCTLALYLCQQRWSYYLLPVAIVTVAPLLGALFSPEHVRAREAWPTRMLIGLSAKEQARRRMPLVLGALILPFAFLVSGTPPEVTGDTANRMAPTEYMKLARTQQRNDCHSQARALIRSGELTRVLHDKPQILLAPTDLGTEILFFTNYDIIASNYHRDGAALKYAWGADKITDEAALRAHLQHRKVSALLLCPKVAPEKNSVLQGFLNSKPLPSWLRRIDYTLPEAKEKDVANSEETAVPTIPPLLLRVVLP